MDDEYYGTTKSVNPGRTLEQFFPGTISTCSLSEGLVPLPSGLYKNSITVGPGCVDGSGTAVTADNYRDMTGRPLYISTALLRKMGRKAGDTLEYTTYLCTDDKGTGASDNASEAFKSICSKTFTLKLTD